MTKQYTIAVIPGDGIGRDVVKAARIVVDAVNDVAKGFTMDFLDLYVSQAAVDKFGEPFPQETRDGIKRSNAILFGAAGISRVLGDFRTGYDLYANVRPIKALPGVNALHKNADLIIIRENTEGLYSRHGWIDRDYHVNLRIFTTQVMERILRFSFDYALKEGRNKITFTHKAKVLVYTDGAWLEMFNQIAKEYPQIESEEMTIDTCAMEIVMHPERLDVIITENANGDILSDVGAGIIGGKGYAYSGNIGDSLALFEPIHGTAPKYADKNIANPCAAIMAAMFMFDYLGEKQSASRILQSLTEVLVEGKVRTYHMGGNASTTDFGEAVAERIRRNANS
ncbi:MAG: isocitrate/isopropylmalate dehydrogenase family protein [Methanothrix sp.]|nr:isocitrate/isopropylmalate dehydrogenase family protein [Methanothrix sp.]